MQVGPAVTGITCRKSDESLEAQRGLLLQYQAFKPDVEPGPERRFKALSDLHQHPKPGSSSAGGSPWTFADSFPLNTIELYYRGPDGEKRPPWGFDGPA